MSKLVKALLVLIGLALAFTAGMYGTSLLDQSSNENMKSGQKEHRAEESGLSEAETEDEGIGEVSSEDTDGHKITDADPSEIDDGLIIIDSDDESYQQAPTEYSEADLYDNEEDDELPEVPIIP